MGACLLFFCIHCRALSLVAVSRRRDILLDAYHVLYAVLFLKSIQPKGSINFFAYLCT